MKKSVIIPILAVFLITSCNGVYITNDKTFDEGLQGVWVSNDTSIYSGMLEINIDRITITGFNEGQTPPKGDDNNRPFKDFTKGTALKGYSEESKIFIEDGGLQQEGIPYTLYTVPTLTTVDDFLRFTFGTRVETMQKQRDY